MKKFILFYSIFVSAIFLFAISFFGLNLYKEYSNGLTRTSNTFNSLVTNIKSSQSKGIDIQNCINIINQNTGNFNDYSYIEVTVDGTQIYKYPTSVNLTDISTSMSQTYDTIIPVGNSKIEIQTCLYLLRPSSIFYYSKISFLIILIMTIITVVLIIYLNMNDSTNNEAIVNDEEPEIIEQQEIVTEENTAVEIEQTADSETEVTQTVVENNITDDSVLTDEEVDNNTNVQPEETKVELPSEEEKPMVIDNMDQNENTPSGLFNETTGIGWESYLLTRLDNELNRAIASEIDLALFIFELPEVQKESDQFKNICNYLSIQFQFKDLIFEYKENCIAAMKISMDIDQALNFADKLFVDIKNMLNDKDCYIGISTRSIRMVSGERILHEADEALIHAKEEKDSPIIAFRVDAEKYRKFLEQNNN